ncbi:hypothetical protein CsatB_019032 [Cannabis sativa]
MVEFEEVEDYYENGMEESLELEYELTQPKIEDEVIEHEMNENELVAWKIMLNFLSITKEPELINESDRRGKEFLSMEQAEEFYTLYSKVIGFSVRKKNKKAQHERTMWADTFLRGHYFGDARATGRCESMNAFLKRDLVMDLPLWMFLRHCDISLAMLRYNEMREHYKTTMTDPVLNQTNMESVEDEVASIFTREIFTRIRDEIKRSDKYVFEKAGTRTNYTICSVAKYRHESRKRTVLYSDDGEDVRCDCYWFETNGIPCQHIFTCMKSLHKHSFQSCLINYRWLKDAKEILPANLGLERKCPHPQMIENSRYGGVTTQTSLVAFYATRSKASFELTMEVLSELLVKLEKIPTDEDYSQNNADDDEFGDKILDSRVLPTKG